MWFRPGLAASLPEQPGWAVPGEAANGVEAIGCVAALRPDVVVLGVEVAEIRGIEAARRIRAISPGTTIVALSMYARVQFQQRRHRAGASLRPQEPADRRAGRCPQGGDRRQGQLAGFATSGRQHGLGVRLWAHSAGRFRFPRGSRTGATSVGPNAARDPFAAPAGTRPTTRACRALPDSRAR
ncbi:response regulator transcription factor [Accumulibacter sp.]|uniref:response regulator n=1 Tax=Accumulibacter sp. TaxID=2053492 RepID=UPI0035AE1869